MADQRGFFKLTNSFPEHQKIAAAGGDAGWLWICGTAYCSRNFTDGMIPIGIVPRLSDREHPQQIARVLLEVGLWHAAGHDCARCVQPDSRHYLVHDYLEHQTSAERARETSVKRSIAGQKGGKAKAAASKLPDAGYNGASSKSLPEVEVEVEVETKAKDKPPTPRKRAVKAATPKPEDPETEARRKLAEEILRWWWEQLTTKPAGKNAWHASLRVVTNLLAVGHEPKAVAAAAREIGTPLTVARMEIALGRTNGHRVAEQRPATSDLRAAQGQEALSRLKQRIANGTDPLLGAIAASSPQQPIALPSMFRELEQ